MMPRAVDPENSVSTWLWVAAQERLAEGVYDQRVRAVRDDLHKTVPEFVGFTQEDVEVIAALLVAAYDKWSLELIRNSCNDDAVD